MGSKKKARRKRLAKKRDRYKKGYAKNSPEIGWDSETGEGFTRWFNPTTKAKKAQMRKQQKAFLNRMKKYLGL